MKKIPKNFDEWLLDRLGMTEQQLRKELEKNVAYYHYDSERPDAVIECYRRKYRHDVDVIGCEGIDLTFLEWFEVFYGQTPSRFHQLCVATGTSARDETISMSYFHRRWEERRELLMLGKCPFENKED